MLQRILGGVLVLLGLVSAALGVASATVWRDSNTVVATAEPAGDGTMVVTDPGVLGLVGDDVTVTATVPEGQKVTLAVGRDVDVLGWVGDDPYTTVTGLEDWQTLGTEPSAPADSGDADAAEAPKKGPDPSGSDMWVAEASDTDTATLRWSDRPGRWTLLAAGVGDGAEAPTVQLTWSRSVSTPYLWPAVGVGAALVVAGVLVLVLGGRRRRDDGDGTRSGGIAASGAEASSAPTVERTSAMKDDEAGSLFAPVAAGTVGADTRVDPGSATDDGSDASPEASPEASPAAVPDEASGTAEVPVTGRLLRRSRRRSTAPAEEEGSGAAGLEGDTPTSVVHEPVPAAPQETGTQDAGTQDAGTQPALPLPDDDALVTGSVPRVTRRELRAQEEARRAAEQGGVTRMLRAMTGQTPVVRPQAQAGSEQGPAADPSTPAGRAAAWRATWGFGQGAGRGMSTSTQAAGTDDATTEGSDKNPTTDANDDGENR